jgi:hypothetical protein
MHSDKVLFLSSGDLAYCAAVQIALDAHDIPHADVQRTNPWQVALTDIYIYADDFDRAKAAIGDLQQTPITGPIEGGRRWQRVLMVSGVLFLAVWIAFIINSIL